MQIARKTLDYGIDGERQDAPQKAEHEGRLIFEYLLSVFGVEIKHMPFARDIPPGSLYEPPFLADTLGRLSFAADRQLFVVVTGDAGRGKFILTQKFVSILSPKDYIVMYTL